MIGSRALMKATLVPCEESRLTSSSTEDTLLAWQKATAFGSLVAMNLQRVTRDAQISE